MKLAAVLPWDELAKIYHRVLSAEHGRPSVEARRVIGSLIIKHKETLSDGRTIEAIQENVYQQYFLGLTQYQYEPVFDPSLFVTIRKRIGVEAFDAMVQELIRVANEPPRASSKAQKNTEVLPTSSGLQEQNVTVQASSSDVSSPPEPAVRSSRELQANAGMLIVDMTVAPADIAYPTDMELLNTSREKTEELVDVLHDNVLETLAREKKTQSIKPRTYRKNARREYLVFAKKRKKTHKFIRKSLRKQLNYVGRNIRTIHTLLDGSTDGLSHREMKLFWIIQELYRQQKEMYETKTHRISDRIVSLAQPHVRPIVRGKASAPVEFGAQVSVGIMNGYRRIERILWDPYNESSDLKEQIEGYKATYGCYPEIVLGDKKYGTKENRAFMKQHGIHYGGTPLGRPRIDGSRDPLLPKQIVNQRNHIEGTFGTGKRSYGLNRIRARRSDTSISWIAAIFFVMNLPLFLRTLGSSFLSFFVTVLTRLIPRLIHLNPGLHKSISRVF